LLLVVTCLKQAEPRIRAVLKAHGLEVKGDCCLLALFSFYSSTFAELSFYDSIAAVLNKLHV
jgi:hypothetical protein